MQRNLQKRENDLLVAMKCSHVFLQLKVCCGGKIQIPIPTPERIYPQQRSIAISCIAHTPTKSQTLSSLKF